MAFNLTNSVRRIWNGDPGDRQNGFRKAFIVVATLLLLLMLGLSKGAGINGDDRFLVPASQYILDFYTSFGSDRTVLHNAAESANTEEYREFQKKHLLEKYGVDSPAKLNKKQKQQFERDHKTPFEAKILKDWDRYIPGRTPQYYGGLFEFLNAVLALPFGGSHEKNLAYHDVRHSLCSIFGWIAILFAGLIAVEIIGWRAGLIVLVFMFLSPRFLGHSMMNPKDLPFATTYAVAFYGIILFLKTLPKPSKKAIIILTVGIAAAINVRIGGILLLTYTFLFLGAWFVWFNFILKKNKNKIKIGPLVKPLAIIVVGGFLGGMLFWPFGLIDPLSHPFEALKYMTNFKTNIRQLFEGQQIMSFDLPWYYLSKYILITTPLIIVAGLALLLPLHFINWKTLQNGLIGVLAFGIVFPLFYIVYKESNVYSGWRHVLFVYPLIAVLAAVGWELLMQSVPSKSMKTVIAVLMAIGLIMPTILTNTLISTNRLEA